jgi:hypothetical protein
MALEALQRWAGIYHVEGYFAEMAPEERREAASAEPAALGRTARVAATGAPPGARPRDPEAIDYSLNHWDALTLHLDDGAVPIDNNHLERLIKPWKVGAKNWLFIGSELAERASGRRYEPGAVGKTQQDRSVDLPARRARAHPRPPCRTDRRTAAASLATSLRHRGYATELGRLDG